MWLPVASLISEPVVEIMLPSLAELDIWAMVLILIMSFVLYRGSSMMKPLLVRMIILFDFIRLPVSSLCSAVTSFLAGRHRHMVLIPEIGLGTLRFGLAMMTPLPGRIAMSWLNLLSLSGLLTMNRVV